MMTRHLRAAVLAVGCACFALSTAAQTPQPRPLYDRYTEPIQIFKTEQDRACADAKQKVSAQDPDDLEGQGTRSPDVDADLAASWSRADTWIRSSRF